MIAQGNLTEDVSASGLIARKKVVKELAAQVTRYRVRIQFFQASLGGFISEKIITTKTKRENYGDTVVVLNNFKCLF